MAKYANDLEQEKAFIDAGYTTEQIGSVTIYKRAVSKEVIDASIQISAGKRQIGYTSKDFERKVESTNKD